MAIPDKKPLLPPPPPKRKIDWNHVAHEAAAVFCISVVILGCMLMVATIAKKEIARTVHPPPLPIPIKEACQKTAEIYFRLGVTCSALVMTRHIIDGEPLPTNPDQLLIETKAYVEIMGGKEEYLK